MKKSEYYIFLGSLFVTVLAGYATMIVDAAVGGRYLGEDAVSAVNLLIPVNEMFYAVGLLLGTGANTVAALALGRGDTLAVRKYFTVGLVSLCIAMALGLILVLCFGEPIAWILSEGGQLYDYTLSYLSSIVVFSAFNGVFLIFKLFTAMTGRPRLVMFCALCQLTVNVICDILFVKTFGLGIKGLAYSSIFAVLVGLGIIVFYCVRRDCPFRIVWMDGRDFLSVLKSNVRYGLGYISIEAVYILFSFLMNALVLRFTGESGLFCWSVAVLICLVGCYAVGAAQETCISLGGKYLGLSDKSSASSIYKRSFVFVTLWMVAVLASVFAFPDSVLPFLGVRDSDASLMKVLLCVIPYIFGTNFCNLAFIAHLQNGHIIRYIVLSTVLYLSVPILFVVAHCVVPGNEWYGITCVAFIQMALLLFGSKVRKAI